MPLAVQKRDFAALVSGARDVHLVSDDERLERAYCAVYPGSFHPLHSGHRNIARIASEILQSKLHYELSISNVDKPDLTLSDACDRLRQFDGNDAVCLTRAATFLEKSKLFPNTTFVVGADTIWRTAQTQYYDGHSAMLDAIDQFAARGCRFLVFGRLLGDVFCELGGIPAPESLLCLCQGVTENQFRHDVSSTELRRSRL